MIFDPESGLIYGTSFNTRFSCRVLGGLVEPHRSEDDRPSFNLSPAVSSALRRLTFAYLAQQLQAFGERLAEPRFSGPPPHMLNLMS